MKTRTGHTATTTTTGTPVVGRPVARAISPRRGIFKS